MQSICMATSPLMRINCDTDNASDFWIIISRCHRAVYAGYSGTTRCRCSCLAYGRMVMEQCANDANAQLDCCQVSWMVKRFWRHARLHLHDPLLLAILSMRRGHSSRAQPWTDTQTGAGVRVCEIAWARSPGVDSSHTAYAMSEASELINLSKKRRHVSTRWCTSP